MYDYFFSGDKYIRVQRGDTGPGSVDAGYPAPISNWGWGSFGAGGIDAALYSGSKCYFFKGNQYIRVTRGTTGAGTVDAGYPAPISNWGWGSFGANGIDAALWSGTKCYFFKGNQYIRVTRGDTGAGTVDAGYPAPISNWNWGSFGANGIDAALYSGAKCYFFKGNQYIRVSRSEVGPGLLDAGYPASIDNWKWGAFGTAGIKGALYSGGPLVAPPAGTGLVSNHNYLVEEGGATLLGVSVAVKFDSDFVSSANGYSFQLNAYSKAGLSTADQQYVVYASPNSTQLVARIDNWVNTGEELIRVDVNLATLPSAKIPAGYAMTLTLNNDSSGNVTGATYEVFDKTGKSIGKQTINVAGQTLRTTGKAATAANTAPIVAYQFNIGGDYGGSTATLSSGLGTLTYTASKPMSVQNTVPSYVDQSFYTVENANLAFGPMPASANAVVSQSFVVTAAPSGSDLAQVRTMEKTLNMRGRALPPPGSR
jgi:hypothetical protein